MKILVFGGNGFIGAETVVQLLKKDATITVANRGKSWDWDTPETIKPRVKWIKMDRKIPLINQQELMKCVENEYFDLTIDFSGFKGKQVKDTIKLMTNRTSLYIYISSDSVYEVCKEKANDKSSVESDAVRPETEHERVKAKRRDSYGHEKLSGEEVIVEHYEKNGGPPYVFLRLADVIGPKDSSQRFWQYQIWVEVSGQIHIPVWIPSKYVTQPLSFVFVKDIAKLIARIAEMDSNALQSVCNQAYNLACVETVTLKEFLTIIQSCLDIKDLQVRDSDSECVPDILPSVERGPVNIGKARSMLGWCPTPLQLAIKETVDFNKNVVSKQAFREERESVYEDVEENLSELFVKHTYIKALKLILGLK